MKDAVLVVMKEYPKDLMGSTKVRREDYAEMIQVMKRTRLLLSLKKTQIRI